MGLRVRRARAEIERLFLKLVDFQLSWKHVNLPTSTSTWKKNAENYFWRSGTSCEVIESGKDDLRIPASSKGTCASVEGLMHLRPHPSKLTCLLVSSALLTLSFNT